MAKKAVGLTARQVETRKAPGLIADGGGLYLQIAPTGARTWIYRYQIVGRRRDMGLGSAAVFSLAEARDRARAARRMVADGIDPIDARRAAVAAKRVDAAKTMTFAECAERYIAAHRAGWKNPKHAAQWPSTLATYVYPALASLPVHAVDTALVTRVIDPIWATKPETASRVRGRIEAVLDWATARGYRKGENPARWRGHLDNLLPARSKVRRVKHHAALPYAEVGAFMAELRQQEGVAARALEFAILTAARTGEVIGARRDEINMVERLWAIPGERMKAGKEHRVPLSAAALAIIETMSAIRSGDFVFPGGQLGRPLSNMALLMALRRMARDNLTAHGFRSTFRDWAAERTNFPSEVAEMALAHVVGDKVEAAYRRGDLFQKRRQLAEAWAKFCESPPPKDDVVPIRRREG
jgi:integrase